MAHARRFHEPGVGGRTGISVDAGALDLDAFFQAGRRALGGGGGRGHGRTKSGGGSSSGGGGGGGMSGEHEAVASETQAECRGDDNDDEEPGMARFIQEPQWSSADGMGGTSASMAIEQSPAPSPRSTLRHSFAADLISSSDDDDMQISLQVTPRRSLPSSASPSPTRKPSLDNVRLHERSERNSSEAQDATHQPQQPRPSLLARVKALAAADGSLLTGSTEEAGPSSPSPVLDRRKALQHGLSAGLEARQRARKQQTASPHRWTDSNSVAQRHTPTNVEDVADTTSQHADRTRTNWLDDEDHTAVDARRAASEASEAYEQSDDEIIYSRDGTSHLNHVSSRETSKAISAPHMPLQKKKRRPVLAELNGNAGTQRKQGGDQSKKRRGTSNVSAPAKAANITSKQAVGTQTERGGRIVERVPSSYQRLAGMHHSEDEMGEEVRRSTRYRYKPLEYWRGETVRYGRPSLPSENSAVQGTESQRQRGYAGETVGDDTIDENAFEDHVLAAPPPVAVLKEIIRVPRAEGEGTFSGIKMRAASKVTANTADPYMKPRSKADKARKQALGANETHTDPTAPTLHVEDGWDKETPTQVKVLDPATKEEIEKEVVRTASQMRPRMAVGCTFGFEKVFVIDDFMATGVLFLLVGGQKPVKNSKDNYYTFTVLEGCVRVTLHGTGLIVAPQGMVFVPKGNDYSIENISQRVARLAFTQCKRPVAASS